MYRISPWQKFLPPLILFFSLFAIYLLTLAPGITWANDGSDGGDLIAAAATGGVAHPTGYPLYLLLARLFQFLPLGSLAFRTNLMSAVAAVLAALLVYEIVRRSSSHQATASAWLSGLTQAFAFGLAPLVWSQAVVTEVYTLQACLTAMVLYLYTVLTPSTKEAHKRLDCWRGLTLGLAMGNHISTILILPAVLIAGSLDHQVQPGDFPEASRSWFSKMRFDRSSLLRQLGMFAAGSSLYLLIPLRAMANPPVNWGNAVTPERFWWLVSGQLYQSYYLHFSLTELWGRLQAGAAILLQQFGVPGIVVGLVGLILYGKPSRLFLLTAWMAVVFTGFAVIYGSDDSYVYLIPAFLSFAIWVGFGVIGLSNQFAQWFSLPRIVLPLLLLSYLAVQSLTQVGQLDASRDTRAEHFGREVLSAAPEDAIIFARGDRAVFALWYFHFALAERTDLSVLAEDLLHFDWYQENLRATYPSLVLPGPFPWPETIAIANPSRPICYARYSDRPELDCLSP